MIQEPIRRVDGKSFGRPTHHYVDATGARIPGVTSIIEDGLPKPALIGWAAKITAETAVNRWAELGELPVAERLKVLKGCRYEERDAAARRGTEVHALAEQLVHGQQVEVPEELAGHVDSYLRFLEDWDPQPVLTEAVVYSRPFQYAGTLDLVATMGSGQRLLCDVKTNRSGVYGDVAFQLAAYRYADRYLDHDGQPQDMPEVDGTAVIWVRSDGYDLIPVHTDLDVLKEFRHIAVVARAQAGAKEYVGEALQPARVAS